MRPDTTLKRYHVNVEGMTVTVKARSAYFAAIVYNAVAGFAEACQAPLLTDSTVLRIRAVGERRVHRIAWRQVVDWAQGEARVAFENTTAGDLREKDLCVEGALRAVAVPAGGSMHFR